MTTAINLARTTLADALHACYRNTRIKAFRSAAYAVDLKMMDTHYHYAR